MGGESSFKPVINLGNSIVGVSILALPYCFSQCGVVLGFLLVFCTALLTMWSCKMLIRAANMTRSHTYETLALAVFNKGGKLIIEISIIALNIGTCIAYFVIIGDLAPPIIAKLIGIHMTPGTFRAVLLILSALFIAFPLGLLRNVDSLSAVSISSLLFYFSLTAEVVYLSRGNLLSGVWRSNVIWWNSSGILKCLPIISLAFACHTQMFVIYSSLHDPGVRRMSGIAEKAIWLICSIYVVVGVFGYVTYCDVEVKGDILSNFSLDLVAQLFRLGFSLSVVLSFPLMIFPCRASIYSLFFSQAPNELHVQEPIPQNRFVAITAGIVTSTVIIAILIPNIETVLALTGATTGSLICFIFPGLLFLKVAGSSADFSNRAKLVLVIGLVSMVLSTAVVIHTESTRQNVELEFPAQIENENKEPDIVKLPPVDVNPDEKMDDKGDGVQDEGGGGGDEERRKEPALPQLPPVDDGDRKPEEVDKPVEQPVEPAKLDNPAGNVIDIPPNDGEEERKVQELPNINDGKVREEEEVKKDVPRKRERAELEERQQDEHVKEKQKVEEGGVEGKGEEKVVEGDKAEGAHERIAEHLEKLSDRVEKLEMENQQLREKQEVIERIQIQQGEDEEGEGDNAQGGDKMAVKEVGLDNNDKAQDEARADDLKVPPAGARGEQDAKIELVKQEQAILNALERDDKEKEKNREEVAEEKREHGVVERRDAEGDKMKEEEGIVREHQEGGEDGRKDDKVEIAAVRQLEVEAVGENAGNMAAPKMDDNQPPPKEEEKYKRRDILMDRGKDDNQPPPKEEEKYKRRDILMDRGKDDDQPPPKEEEKYKGRDLLNAVSVKPS